VKPVLFVTGQVPAYRAGALARLHERELLEVALFGGSAKHGGGVLLGELPFPHRRVRPGELYALAASGRHRAVVCSTGGRAALLAGWTGARRARLPLVLWASLWAHPRPAIHALSYVPLGRLYRRADAVVTYGPHVSAYVTARGARNVHVAPQSVDNDFWRSAETAAPSGAWPAEAELKLLFVGRPAREKGLHVLLDAWIDSGLRPPAAALVLVGAGSAQHGPSDPLEGCVGEGVVRLGSLSPVELRDVYAAGDLLVAPSIATRNFREPWGLVVNEAMNRELPVIASDAVGAAAGGLVRDGRNGRVVPAGDRGALMQAMLQLSTDAPLRAYMGRAGAQEVLAYSHEAWAEGFSRALSTLGVARERW
jgi:glycosyltransferase involved in cell wall biosynthesis